MMAHFIRPSELGARSGATSATKNEQVFYQLQQFLECKRAIEQIWSVIIIFMAVRFVYDFLMMFTCLRDRLERILVVGTVQLPNRSWNLALLGGSRTCRISSGEHAYALPGSR